MTTLMDNTIDELVRRMKERTAMTDFVFSAEYPPRELPNPIDRYVVTVTNNCVRVKRQFVGGMVAEGIKGALYECSLRLRTYAPENTSGAALLRATSLLADALDAADTDRAVQEMTLSDVAYDAVARTVWRDLNVTLGFVLCEEAAA